MAENNKKSVEDILAACRKVDSGDSSGAADVAPSDAAESVSSEPSAAPAQPAKKAADMSVAEMLAAARGEGGAKPKESAPAAKKGPAATASSKKGPAAPAKKPGAMSVADMLAAARGEKSAGEKSAAAKEKPAAKKAAAPQAKKPAKKAAKAVAGVGGPKDTTSILAAARGTAKPGPVSKSEASGKAAPAAKGKKPKLVAPPMPAKPAYAKGPSGKGLNARKQGAGAKAKGKAAAGSDRRSFFGIFFGSFMAVGFSSLGMVNLLWVLGMARFMFPNILTEPPTKFKVGPAGNLSPGSVETKFKAQFGVWIVRHEYEGESQIFALKTVCTHLGCTPNWLEAEQKFKCPCHGSGFYKDGINFEGPAPRPLERYAIRVADDGQLEVDKSKKYQEEMGQWADSASYVTG